MTHNQTKKDLANFFFSKQGEGAPAVEVQNLSYTFPDGTRAIHNVSFIVEEGEKLAIIGPNGAGKSTLLLLLNGILRGDGLVRIKGFELNRRHARLIRSQTGLLFQDPDDQLIMPVVLDDVAFGLCSRQKLKDPKKREEIVGRIRKQLVELGIEHLLHRSTLRLSLGEKKKVALAGVLIKDPDILLFDEPAAGLDPAGRRWLEAYLRGIKKTTILATHDLELARKICPKVILLSQGELVAQGNTDEVLQQKEILARAGL